MTRVGWLAISASVLAVGGCVLLSQDERADPSAPAMDGRALFQSKGCATCHAGPDSSSAMGAFPSLVDASTFAGSRRDGLSGAEYLAESIRTPSAFISPAWMGGAGPTTNMPYLEVSDDEVDALVRYLLQG